MITLETRKLNVRFCNSVGVFFLFFVFTFFKTTSLTAQIQVYGIGDNKFQSFASGGTASGAATNGSLKLVAIIGQPLIISSGSLTQTQAGILSASNNGVLVKDKVPPKITSSAVVPTLNKGTSNSNNFNITVSDNIAVASASISYKKLMAPSSSFVNTTLNKGTSANAYSITIQDSWYDDMGMEYFYTAFDKAGNSVRDPVSGTYFSFLKDPSALLPASRYSVGNKLSNYRIIALPYVNDSGEDISNVFGTSSGLPAYSSANDVWRLGTYDTKTQSFSEYPTSLTSFNRGKGYWFILNKQVNQISFGAKVSPNNTRNNLFKIPLKIGWNLIGNPYPTKINWSEVQQFQGNPVVGDLSSWDGGWSLVTDWSAFQGGYVNSLVDGDLTIPFPGQSTLGGKIASAYFGADISSTQWQVDLHIFQENSFNKLGRFGMINATIVGDDFKSYNPPPLENSPEINFSPERLCRMIVPTATQSTWLFEVLGETGKEAELRWNSDLGSGPEALYLLDLSANQLLNMKEVTTYQFTLEKNHMFKIFFGTGSNLFGNDVVISKPYPNPVQDRSTSFIIALPDSSPSFDVDFQLFGADGAIVNYLNKVMTSGAQPIDWKFGEELKTGLYYYRIRVSSKQFSKTETGKLLIQ